MLQIRDLSIKNIQCVLQAASTSINYQSDIGRGLYETLQGILCFLENYEL